MIWFEPEDRVVMRGKPGVVVKFWEDNGIVFKSDCGRWYNIDGEELEELIYEGEIVRDDCRK